ncbi:hypothetical protein [Nonomuraea sp. NPDC001831]|uniref:hypothetical protein n=1 Tax=Nonomuraea sp. NPDC001831 TaxID=3364340 RepID=UPI003689D2F9
MPGGHVAANRSATLNRDRYAPARQSHAERGNAVQEITLEYLAPAGPTALCRFGEHVIVQLDSGAWRTDEKDPSVDCVKCKDSPNPSPYDKHEPGAAEVAS